MPHEPRDDRYRYGIGETAGMWRKMKPLSVRLFAEFWIKMSQDIFIDLTKAEYGVWKGQRGFEYEGMKLKGLAKGHGLFRTIDDDGIIQYGCFKDIKKLGLWLTITDVTIDLEICRYRVLESMPIDEDFRCYAHNGVKKNSIFKDFDP